MARVQIDSSRNVTFSGFNSTPQYRDSFSGTDGSYTSWTDVPDPNNFRTQRFVWYQFRDGADGTPFPDPGYREQNLGGDFRDIVRIDVDATEDYDLSSLVSVATQQLVDVPAVAEDFDLSSSVSVTTFSPPGVDVDATADYDISSSVSVSVTEPGSIDIGVTEDHDLSSSVAVTTTPPPGVDVDATADFDLSSSVSVTTAGGPRVFWQYDLPIEWYEVFSFGFRWHVPDETPNLRPRITDGLTPGGANARYFENLTLRRDRLGWVLNLAPDNTSPFTQADNAHLSDVFEERGVLILKAGGATLRTELQGRDTDEPYRVDFPGTGGDPLVPSSDEGRAYRDFISRLLTTDGSTGGTLFLWNGLGEDPSAVPDIVANAEYELESSVSVAVLKSPSSIDAATDYTLSASVSVGVEAAPVELPIDIELTRQATISTDFSTVWIGTVLDRYIIGSSQSRLMQLTYTDVLGNRNLRIDVGVTIDSDGIPQVGSTRYDLIGTLEEAALVFLSSDEAHSTEGASDFIIADTDTTEPYEFRVPPAPMLSSDILSGDVILRFEDPFVKVEGDFDFDLTSSVAVVTAKGANIAEDTDFDLTASATVEIVPNVDITATAEFTLQSSVTLATAEAVDISVTEDYVFVPLSISEASPTVVVESNEREDIDIAPAGEDTSVDQDFTDFLFESSVTVITTKEVTMSGMLDVELDSSVAVFTFNELRPPIAIAGRDEYIPSSEVSVTIEANARVPIDVGISEDIDLDASATVVVSKGANIERDIDLDLTAEATVVTAKGANIEIDEDIPFSASALVAVDSSLRPPVNIRPRTQFYSLGSLPVAVITTKGVSIGPGRTFYSLSSSVTVVVATPEPLDPSQISDYASAEKRGLARNSDVYALVISHPDIDDDIRIVADSQDMTIDAETYTALAFRAVPPSFKEGEVPRAALEIDNVGKTLMEWIERTGGGRGAKMIVRQVVRDPSIKSLGYVVWEMPALPVGVAQITNESVQVTLAYRTGRSRPGIKWRHDPATSPGLY